MLTPPIPGIARAAERGDSATNESESEKAYPLRMVIPERAGVDRVTSARTGVAASRLVPRARWFVRRGRGGPLTHEPKADDMADDDSASFVPGGNHGRQQEVTSPHARMKLVSGEGTG